MVQTEDGKHVFDKLTEEGRIGSGNLLIEDGRSIIRNLGTKTFTADIIVKETVAKTFTADVIIVNQHTKTFTADAIIDFQYGRIMRRRTAISQQVHLFPKFAYMKTFTADIIVKETVAKTFTADIIVKETVAKTFTADVIIINQHTKTFTADAIIDFRYGIIIRRRTAISQQVHLFPKCLGTKTFTADVLLQATSTKTFTADLILVETAEERGFYYAKIGSTIFTNLNNDSFRITEELNKIPSFEFEIANTTENRAAIVDGLTDILRIYNRVDSTDTLMFTGIINGDAIEYLSLERIRLVGYASYIDLNWRFHKHLNSEDAEDVGSLFDYLKVKYSFYIKGAVNATTAGAQTNYQLKLVVGESSGVSGADVHCNNHCVAFPNDIRFTKEDGLTKHDYWVDVSTLEGTTPNRKVSVWIEVATIPASGSVDFYMFYGASGDNGESNGDNSFIFFDDFEYDTKEISLGNSGCEAIVIVGDYLYYGFDSSPGVIKKYNKSDLSFVSSLSLTNNGIEEMYTDDSTYIYVGQDNGKLAKIQISTFTEVSTLTLTQGTGLIAGLVIAGDYLYAGRAGDILARILLSNFSSVSYLSMAANTGFAEPGVSDGSYLYVPGEKNGYGCRLNKVKLSDFTLETSLILSKNNGQQNPIIDNGFIYVACEGTSDNGAIVKVDLSTFTETSALVFSGDGQAKMVLKEGAYLYIPSYKASQGFLHKVALSTFTEAEEWDMGGYRPAEAAIIDSNYLYIAVDKGTGWTDCYLRKLLLSDFGLGFWIPFDVAGGTATMENDTYVFTDTSGSQNVHSKQTLNNLTNFCVEMQLKNENVAQYFYCYLRDTSDKNIATVFFYNDELRYFNGATDTKWGDAVDDTYNHWGIGIDQPANHQDLFLAGSKIVDDASMRDATAGAATKVELVTSTTGLCTKGTVNWIAIREYTSPEPTWGSWGSEQVAGNFYVDYTTAANNDTINDVLPTFGGVNDVLYIGQGEQFFGAQVKYSTKGVQAGSTSVVFEYSKGSSVWATLDVLDETRAFTEDVGTSYITIPHKPSDWAKETVNSVKKFWIRARITAGSYTTAPKLDRIKITNVDVFRVYYFETAANSIMDDLLAGTGYSMDVTDACPTTEISIVAEYETKLRFIAGITNALTWDDNGDKKAYQWWIDTSKKVHLKQKRGDTLGDMSSKLTVLNNVQDYFNLSNRLHYLGNYDGLNQIKAVIEDTSSQDTHEIRELAVPEERYNNYIPLKEAAEKAMTYTKEPLQKISATMPTRNWLNEALEVGDTVTLHQDKWNVSEQAFQIVRADIGPRDVNFDLGVSQEHLDSLKAGLQRRMDISGIRMHGSTLILQFGPDEMNYQRVDDTTVYPSRLKFEIPSDARYIHKVVISWKMGPFRANATGGEEREGHDHEAWAGAGGAHEHGGFAGAGGAHDSSVLDGGLHTPTELGKGHTHTILGSIWRLADWYQNGYIITSANMSTASSHTHSNPDTGYKGGHIHSVGSTGGPSSTANAITSLITGSACDSGACVNGWNNSSFATSSHTHSNPNTGVNGGHDHSIGNTGSAGGHTHTLSNANGPYTIPIPSTETWGLNASATYNDSPEHVHTINQVPAHPHTAVAIAAHANHVIANQMAHGNHSIITQAAAMIDIALGIVEIAGGTTMMLIVNGETVAANYDGDQTDVVITGYTNTGSNTVEIQPIVGANTKGSTSAEGRGILFIETSSF